MNSIQTGQLEHARELLRQAFEELLDVQHQLHDRHQEPEAQTELEALMEDINGCYTRLGFVKEGKQRPSSTGEE